MTEIVKEEKSKWAWMMEWCCKQRLPPANPIFWKQAEDAYEEYVKKRNINEL